MPDIHFRTTVAGSPDDVYRALATQDGLAGNWTDQLEVPDETGAVARFGFGPDWQLTLEVRIDALEPGRRVVWTPVGGFPGWIGTAIEWSLEPADIPARSSTSPTRDGRSRRPTPRWPTAATRGP